MAIPLLRGDSYSGDLNFTESTPMDFVYLLFLIVLCAATLGLLLICDRLSPRK